MKWERYNKLTPEQKEEYQYRFKNNPIMVNINNLALTMGLLLSIITQFVFMTYLVLTDTNGRLTNLQQQVPILMSSSFQVVLVFTIVLTSIVLTWIGYIIIRFIKKHLWLKKNEQQNARNNKTLPKV